jgi:hypothetical protein
MSIIGQLTPMKAETQVSSSFLQHFQKRFFVCYSEKEMLNADLLKVIWGNIHTSFYLRNLQMGQISYTVCPA